MKRNPNDKILDNKFNKGDIKFVALPIIKVDNSYKSAIGEKEDFFDTINTRNLEMIISDELIRLKKEGIKISRKNHEANIIIFYKIYENIDKTIYDDIEFFVTFCEVCGLDIRIMFDDLLPKLKGTLMDALHLRTKMPPPKFRKIF